MSVSLITGISEKVSPSRLTTTRGWCACVLVFARECVYFSAYDYVCLCVSYSYLSSSVKRCACMCVAAKGASVMPGAEIDSLARERK